MVSFDDLRLCKFKCNDIQVIFEDGSTTTIPSMNIMSYSIEKNFFDNFLPIFEVSCMVNYDLYKKINTEKCRYKIDFQKFFVRANIETTFNKNDSLFLKNYLNGIFININTGDNTPDLTNSLSTRDGSNLDQPNNFQKSQLELSLFLFLEGCLDYTKLNNNIFQDVTIPETILGLATITEQRKIMLALPDNKSTRYENVIIPNDLTFLGAMYYLQSVYGIYNKSLVVFNDFDYLYIIDKDNVSKAFLRSDITKVYINYYDITDANGNINGHYEGSNYYEIYSTNRPPVQVPKDTTEKLLGKNINSINTINGDVSNSYDNDTKILDNKYNNKYSENSFEYEKNLLYCIEAKFKDVDPEMFQLNKEYYFKFNSEDLNYMKYDGQYKLVSLQLLFNKTDEEIFENTVQAKFIRA